MEQVARGQLTTGVLAMNHIWPDAVDVVIKAGVDHMIVDMEHSPSSLEAVAAVCTLGRQAGFPILVRPRANDYNTLRLAIDLGPCGLLLAAIESAADLDVVRDAVHLPPRGKRRPGGLGNRWVADFSYESFKEQVEDRFIVLPQIETLQGLKNVGEIAAHQLTTSIAIGPYDLSAELGVCGQMQHPKLWQAIETIHAAGRAAGKAMWMIGDGAQLAERGFHFVCIGELTMMLEGAVRQKAEQAAAARPEG